MLLPRHRARLLAALATLSLLIASAGLSWAAGPDTPPPGLPANQGAAGYLPAFHPGAIPGDVVQAARIAGYAKAPDASNIQLEYPDQYSIDTVCYGRGFDPRGPFAEPPQAPYLLPGHLGALTFSDSGDLYVAVAGSGFQNVSGGTLNNDPAAGNIVNPANKAGIYQVILGADGKCATLRAVSGGPDNVGQNVGPQPQWGDFGSTIVAVQWHNGLLYVNTQGGSPKGVVPGPDFGGGRLITVDPATGNRTALIANLPADGDHQNDSMIFINYQGHEEVEWGEGTVDNAGAVDFESRGDIPCFDIKLTNAGMRFYPFTYGYKRFERNIEGEGHKPLQEVQPDGSVIVRGTLPCNSSTMAIRTDTAISADGDNTSLRVTNIGFRNPYGLRIAPDSVPGIGGLAVNTNNGADVRGQRPIANAPDSVWVFEKDGVPVRNWGWPNGQDNMQFSDPMFGLPNNQLASEVVDTSAEALRAPNQAPQPLTGQAPIFDYLMTDVGLPGEGNGQVFSRGHMMRGGQPAPERVEPNIIPSLSVQTVDLSLDGFDFSTSDSFGLVNDFFAADYGNISFPIGSAPQALVGRDIRRFRVLTSRNDRTKYIGTEQTVFARNKVQPGGPMNINTGGFFAPVDAKFTPAGDALYITDFGEALTIDTGFVGGFRCDDPNDASKCSNGAREFPGSGHTQAEYGPNLVSLPGTDMLWVIRRTGGGGGSPAPNSGGTGPSIPASGGTNAPAQSSSSAPPVAAPSNNGTNIQAPAARP